MELGEAELIVVLGAQHLRLGVIGERAVEVARLHLRARQRHQRIDQSPRLIDCCEDAFRVLELLDRPVQPSAPDIEDAGEHVDEAEDVFPPSLGEAAGLGDQRFDIGNVAEPELHHGKGEQVLCITRIKLEGLLEEGERALCIARKRERALMAKRHAGLPRGAVGLRPFRLGHIGEHIYGEGWISRLQRLDRPPSRPALLLAQRKHGLADQRLDAVALLEGQPVAILGRAGDHLAGDHDGDLLGVDPVLLLVLAQHPAQQKPADRSEHGKEQHDCEEGLERRPMGRRELGEDLHEYLDKGLVTPRHLPSPIKQCPVQTLAAASFLPRPLFGCRSGYRSAQGGSPRSWDRSARSPSRARGPFCRREL